MMLGELDAALRSEGFHRPGSSSIPYRSLALLFVLGGFAYGLVLGSFGHRPLQMLYSAIKVPLLQVVAAMICLPNFFVLNAILGLRDDFIASLKGIISAQVTFAIALAALAPITPVVYFSTQDYRFALNYNGLPFLVALIAAQVTLSRHYRPLIAKAQAHRLALWIWLVLYAFVATQMAWVLRPFIGDPGLSVEFLREQPFSNAYVEIWADIVKLLR